MIPSLLRASHYYYSNLLHIAYDLFSLIFFEFYVTSKRVHRLHRSARKETNSNTVDRQQLYIRLFPLSLAPGDVRTWYLGYCRIPPRYFGLPRNVRPTHSMFFELFTRRALLSTSYLSPFIYPSTPLPQQNRFDHITAAMDRAGFASVRASGIFRKQVKAIDHRLGGVRPPQSM